MTESERHSRKQTGLSGQKSRVLLKLTEWDNFHGGPQPGDRDILKSSIFVGTTTTTTTVVVTDVCAVVHCLFDKSKF